MSSRFQERLDTGPIVVADGGMGVLISSAVPRLRCPEEANIRSPESVVTLHTSFIRAGADLVQLYSCMVYEGPALPGQIVRGLSQILDREKVASIRDLRDSRLDYWLAAKV